MAKVTITISPMLAGVLQRMIEEETNKQKLWSYDDHAPVRKCIIEELNALSDDLQAQGYAKFFSLLLERRNYDSRCKT